MIHHVKDDVVSDIFRRNQLDLMATIYMLDAQGDIAQRQ